MSATSNITPPKIFVGFLRWFCDPYILEDVEGDLNELFNHYLKTKPGKAKLLFARDVFLLFRPGILKKMKLSYQLYGTAMLKNNFITAIRHAYKYKGYTIINLLGLVVGIAASLLILLWIDDEVSKNKFHGKADRIYQAYRNVHQSSGEIIHSVSIRQARYLSKNNCTSNWIMQKRIQI